MKTRMLLGRLFIIPKQGEFKGGGEESTADPWFKVVTLNLN